MHCREAAETLAAQDKAAAGPDGSILLAQDELFAPAFFDGLAEEVEELLQEQDAAAMSASLFFVWCMGGAGDRGPSLVGAGFAGSGARGSRWSDSEAEQERAQPPASCPAPARRPVSPVPTPPESPPPDHRGRRSGTALWPGRRPALLGPGAEAWGRRGRSARGRLPLHRRPDSSAQGDLAWVPRAAWDWRPLRVGAPWLPAEFFWGTSGSSGHGRPSPIPMMQGVGV